MNEEIGRELFMKTWTDPAAQEFRVA